MTLNFLRDFNDKGDQKKKKNKKSSTWEGNKEKASFSKFLQKQTKTAIPLQIAVLLIYINYG